MNLLETANNELHTTKLNAEAYFEELGKLRESLAQSKAVCELHLRELDTLRVDLAERSVYVNLSLMSACPSLIINQPSTLGSLINCMPISNKPMKE